MVTGMRHLTLIVVVLVLSASGASADERDAAERRALQQQELRQQNLRREQNRARREAPRLPSRPNLGARERAPLDPVTKNRIQRFKSQNKAAIRALDQPGARPDSSRTMQLRRARQSRSRFNNQLRGRR